METKIQKLKDGRYLAYAEYGDVKGIPVFYAHGGPGSHIEGQVKSWGRPLVLQF